MCVVEPIIELKLNLTMQSRFTQLHLHVVMSTVSMHQSILLPMLRLLVG
jgi:hypothetical protein